mmetsp:Transcript_26535/g.40892  ORF Transcript_26535/g.40892 Transcript_26535/m.40892 type:complete len:124 (-) Transcript_26535:138-509(-)
MMCSSNRLVLHYDYYRSTPHSFFLVSLSAAAAQTHRQPTFLYCTHSHRIMSSHTNSTVEENKKRGNDVDLASTEGSRPGKQAKRDEEPLIFDKLINESNTIKMTSLRYGLAIKAAQLLSAILL